MKRMIAALLICGLMSGAFSVRGLAAEEEENPTSVIIDMNDLPATQIGVGADSRGNPYNDYESLKVPAQLTRQGDYYFIVDTYHNQVLYAADMWKPLSEWRVMSRDFNMPHAIASDGEMYLVVDTDNNRVMCYEYVNGKFQNTQRFDNVGTRPHYIQYDSITQSFFVWSSMTGDMYIIKKEPLSGRMYIDEMRHINELDGFYVRSFSIDGDEIIFPSGNNSYMIIADKTTFAVKERYAVTPEISGMACVRKIGGYWYMSVSTDETLKHDDAKLIRTSDLSLLSLGLYEDITASFKSMELPYYIEAIGGSYYVTNHGGRHSIYKFDIADDMIMNVVTVQ
ncbi:MAG: hypothetical protein LUE96_03805 [Lachnospiraceae bacterium]|nr:hypothetical protein [Lachnospiraceae bacterium]